MARIKNPGQGPSPDQISRAAVVSTRGGGKSSQYW